MSERVRPLSWPRANEARTYHRYQASGDPVWLATYRPRYRRSIPPSQWAATMRGFVVGLVAGAAGWAFLGSLPR